LLLSVFDFSQILGEHDPTRMRTNSHCAGDISVATTTLANEEPTACC
jgi:hypothetical protein